MIQNLVNQNLEQSVQNQSLTLSEKEKGLFEMAVNKVPSGGNCKPFEVQWASNKLLISHNDQLAKHYLNRDNRSSWIALGCLKASVEIVAKNLGMTATMKVIDQNLNAEILFSKNESAFSSFSIQNLLSRSTYRGALKASKAPEVFNSLKTSKSKGIQIKTLSNDKMTKGFTSYLLKAHNYLFMQNNAAKDFFNEIRFFSKKSSNEARGMASSELGVSKQDQVSLFLFSFIPSILSLLVRYSPLAWVFANNTKKAIKNSHFILITAQSLDSKNLINVGVQAMKAWLALEQQGYKVQPYSLATLPVVDALTNSLPADTLEHFNNLFTHEALPVLAETFKCEKSELPVWLLRVGQELQ